MEPSRLIERFIAQELSDNVREVLRGALRQRAESDKVLARQYEFNCFDVEFDFLKGVAVVQDILDSGELGRVEMSISEFIILCGLDD